MILPIFHNLPCEGGWPESESGPEKKKNTNEGAESLSWRFDDFMFQQQGHVPTKHQYGMMANWRQNDAKGLESSSCASDLTVTQQNSDQSTSLWPKVNFVQKPQWDPPKPQQSHLLHHGSTRICESKMLRTGDCSAVQWAALCWLNFQSGLRFLRVRIWVLQHPMNDARRARAWYVLADFSLQFLEPWQFTDHCIWIVVLVWLGKNTKDVEGSSKLSLWGSKFHTSTTACPCFWFSQTCFKARTWPCILLTTQIPTTTRMQNTYFDDQCKEENNIWNQQSGYIEMKVATANCFGSHNWGCCI